MNLNTSFSCISCQFLPSLVLVVSPFASSSAVASVAAALAFVAVDVVFVAAAAAAVALVVVGDVYQRKGLSQLPKRVVCHSSEAASFGFGEFPWLVFFGE